MKPSPAKPQKTIYLLTGKEEFLKKEHIQKLKNLHITATGSSDLNFQIFRAKQEPLSRAIEFSQTSPLLGEKRLSVLRDIEALNEEEKKVLSAYVKRHQGPGVLVLVAREATPRKNKFLNELSASCSVIACHTPFEKELPGWLHAKAKQMNIELTREAAPLLIERCGSDLSSMVSGMDQLSLYIHPRKRIEFKDVESCLGRSIEADVFRLWDALLEKKAKSAIEISSELFKEGTRAFEIIAVFGSQFEKASRAQSLLSSGQSAKEVGSALKIHPFYFQKFMRQVQKMSATSIRKMAQALLQCDEAIKTSQLNEKLALQRLILEVC